MSDIPGVMPSESTDSGISVTKSQPSASDPETAGAIASSNPDAVDGNTKFGSLADLKRKSPKLYNFMMLSIAQNICIQMNHASQRLVQQWKENRRNAGG